jgi:hypothetical protein
MMGISRMVGQNTPKSYCDESCSDKYMDNIVIIRLFILISATRAAVQTMSSIIYKIEYKILQGFRGRIIVNKALTH